MPKQTLDPFENATRYLSKLEPSAGVFSQRSGRKHIGSGKISGFWCIMVFPIATIVCYRKRKSAYARSSVNEHASKKSEKIEEEKQGLEGNRSMGSRFGRIL